MFLAVDRGKKVKNEKKFYVAPCTHSSAGGTLFYLKMAIPNHKTKNSVSVLVLL